jgi:hypothetical protein
MGIDGYRTLCSASLPGGDVAQAAGGEDVSVHHVVFVQQVPAAAASLLLNLSDRVTAAAAFATLGGRGPHHVHLIICSRLLLLQRTAHVSLLFADGCF